MQITNQRLSKELLIPSSFFPSLERVNYLVYSSQLATGMNIIMEDAVRADKFDIWTSQNGMANLIDQANISKSESCCRMTQFILVRQPKC